MAKYSSAVHGKREKARKRMALGLKAATESRCDVEAKIWRRDDDVRTREARALEVSAHDPETRTLRSTPVRRAATRCRTSFECNAVHAREEVGCGRAACCANTSEVLLSVQTTHRGPRRPTNPFHSVTI
jgi:hypothetical protein